MSILKVLPVYALLLSLPIFSVAGTPKGEITAPAPAKVTPPEETLYYFPISDNGTSFDSRTASTSDTSPLCSGQGPYCEVGLSASQVDIVGSTVTVKAAITAPPLPNRTRQD